jgi:hypothetical protein
MPVCGLDFQSAPQIPLVEEAAAVLPAVQAAVDLFVLNLLYPRAVFCRGFFYGVME